MMMKIINIKLVIGIELLLIHSVEILYYLMQCLKWGKKGTGMALKVFLNWDGLGVFLKKVLGW